ncbi:MAG: peptidase, partial [Gammaproteobacteria bacterium]|nr:peptidase [Gammaproteobacteria bacterium]
MVIVLIIIIGPSLWVTRTIKKYSEPNDRYDFSGATFARKLLDALNLQEVEVESTELGDHYDP